MNTRALGLFAAAFFAVAVGWVGPAHARAADDKIVTWQGKKYAIGALPDGVGKPAKSAIQASRGLSHWSSTSASLMRPSPGWSWRWESFWHSTLAASSRLRSRSVSISAFATSGCSSDRV